MKKFFGLIIFSLLIFSCSSSDDTLPITDDGDSGNNDPDPETEIQFDPIDNHELMNIVQRETFRYFWDFAQSSSGAARERYHPNDPGNSADVVATGGSGFGLMAILVGIERGYITREQGFQRLQIILNFFQNAERFHGAWSHWTSGNSGSVIPFSSQDDGGDIVETSFLAMGLITVREYFKNGNPDEILLAQKADDLWKGIEWNFYTNGGNQLIWHWSPNHGFTINLALKGYNETLITYVLAASSPTHPITPQVYQNGWASNGGIQNGNSMYDLPLLVRHGGNSSGVGPLFLSHYSFISLDPRNLQDQYANYWQVTKNHSLVNYRYALDNPQDYHHYGQYVWGLTASYTYQSGGGMGYAAHSPSNDLGVISPTAAVSSIVYTPEESIKAMQYFYHKRDILMGPAGFYDAFSPEYDYWVAKGYLAIDQGPMILMIENYRTQMLWNLFMGAPEIQAGLTSLGFTY